MLKAKVSFVFLLPFVVKNFGFSLNVTMSIMDFAPYRGTS